MDLSAFKLALIVQHHTKPQEAMKIELACRALSEALGSLASMGHLFHLEPGAAPLTDEWPKLLFHFSDSPDGRKVYSAAEAAELGPGWSPDPIEAQRLGGIATQDAGKGASGTVALPAVLYPLPTEPDRIAERARLRAEAKADFLNQRNQGVSQDAP